MSSYVDQINAFNMRLRTIYDRIDSIKVGSTPSYETATVKTTSTIAGYFAHAHVVDSDGKVGSVGGSAHSIKTGTLNNVLIGSHIIISRYVASTSLTPSGCSLVTSWTSSDNSTHYLFLIESATVNISFG